MRLVQLGMEARTVHIQMRSDKQTLMYCAREVWLTMAVNAIFGSGSANVIWPVVPQNARRAAEINQQVLQLTKVMLALQFNP